MIWTESALVHSTENAALRSIDNENTWHALMKVARDVKSLHSVDTSESQIWFKDEKKFK